MKIRWRLLARVCFIGLSAVLFFSPADGPLISAVEDRPVAIATLPCTGALQATSSGFVIDDELVVTVAHAIFESREFAVRDARGVWRTGVVRHMDLARDLAIIEVDGLRATPIPFARTETDELVRLIEGAASGSSSGQVRRPVRITTEVVGDLTTETARRGYELGLQIKAGDSGAGVVDPDDNLVAIVFARSTRREGTTWATAMNEVEAIRDGQEVPVWECGPGAGRTLVLTPPEEDRLA